MFFSITLTLLVVFFVTVYLYFKRYHADINDRLAKIPGLKPQWLLGNLRNSGLTTGEAVFFEVYQNFKAKFGDVFCLWLGPYYGIVLSRLEHVQQVLADRQTYDQSEVTTQSFRILFPAGLITLKGNDWKRHARFILPMFRRAKVLPHLDMIVSCVDRFIDKEFVPGNGKIHSNLIVQCQSFLLNIIAFVAFDYDLEKSSSESGVELRQAFNDFVQYANDFILTGLFPYWVGKLILMTQWKFRRAKHIMKQYVMRIIAEEQKRQEQQKSVVSGRPKNLIASLVAAMKDESSSSEGSLTPNEIFDEVLMSTLGGFETISTTLSWFIFYMTKYPDVQQKIKDELKEHHLTPDAPLTQDGLDSLIYVECVVKEVLRFAPIAGGISRQATRDTMIDDIPVRKGDDITIAVQNLHLDPRYWNIDPTKFIPARFLDEDKNPPHGAYLPFGGGHRACAGQELAFFELKTIFTRLMQRVTFEDPGDKGDNSGGYLQRITCFPKHLAVLIRIDSSF